MPTQNSKQRLSIVADEPISVTVDASDLTVASAEPLRNIIARYGRPVTARAFADFQQPTLAELSIQLYQMGFTLVHCPSWPNGDGVPKTIVSDVMAQDLRDQLEELDEVETFLVVATSRDYIAVANALKRHERRVVVIAEEAKVCRELKLCGDEFALMPATRPERVSRSVEAPRVERVVEARHERPERADVARVERHTEPPKVERAEPVKVVDRPEPAKVAESQDAGRLPGDAEVIAEVRRIVAAEGICTPRRLGRALCPVDKTPTGEMRSRIANRIQSLIDSGKLQRDKLVVGGTSVETIMVREDKKEAPRPAPTPVRSEPAPLVLGPMLNGTPVQENGAEGLEDVIAIPEPPAVPVEPVLEQMEERPVEPVETKPVVAPAPEKTLIPLGKDLDALVESVLRSPELAAGLLHREPEAVVEPQAPETPAEEPQPAPEAPKRSRTRRRTPAKAKEAAEAEKVAVPEGNGTAE